MLQLASRVVLLPLATGALSTDKSNWPNPAPGFDRVGWSPEQYQEWSDHQLAEQRAFVVPTSWRGETVLRYCVVNPLTTVDDIASIVDSLL